MPEEDDLTGYPPYYRSLTPEEVEPSFTVPSFSVNQFVVQPMDMATRIAFGEQAPDTTETYYRFAVTLSNQKAVQLYKVLKISLRKYEEALAATGQQTEAEGDG